MLKSHNKSVFETLGRQPVHPFPARMAAGIALEALGATKRQLVVLDPMSGSGTVIAVARAKGHKAIGVDLDPLAVLLAKVWTHPLNRKVVLAEGEKILAAARKTFKKLSLGQAYPAGSDKPTKEFIRYWFDDYARRQLAALACHIQRVKDGHIRDALWCGFSRLIITKSAGASLAMDLSHSRPHRVFNKAPVKPFNKFMSAVETVVTNCPNRSTGRIGPAARIYEGDARAMRIKSGSVDLVLTSPPYLNAIDYIRCSKFSLVWMGYAISELKLIRSTSIGAEKALEAYEGADWVAGVLKKLCVGKKLTNRDTAILVRYAVDMEKALCEVARVLKKGGRAVYVVGNSTVKGIFIRNSTIVSEAALKHGLKAISSHVRTLPANRRYLPPPNAKAAKIALDARMRQEVVLVFKKAA